MASVTPDPWELLDEAAAQVELWQDRAYYWRQVALEFSTGQRDPYPGEAQIARRLLAETAPLRMVWVDNGTFDHALNPQLRGRWWTGARRGR